MPEPRLCVDIDNVIAQTDEVMGDVIREFTGGHVNFEYGHIKRFNYSECEDAVWHRITPVDWKIVHSLFAERNRILSINPYPFVQSRLRELSNKFSIHLATSRLPKARQATIECLERNCFDLKYDLHFVQHGEKHSSLGRFAASVEDDLNQALDFAKIGVMSFVIDHPWNREVPDRCPSNLQRIVTQNTMPFGPVWDVILNRLIDVAATLEDSRA